MFCDAVIRLATRLGGLGGALAPDDMSGSTGGGPLLGGGPLPRGADEARLADASGNAFTEQGDVFGGDVACKGKAQGAVCRRGIDAHCGEDMRWFGGAG